MLPRRPLRTFSVVLLVGCFFLLRMDHVQAQMDDYGDDDMDMDGMGGMGDMGGMGGMGDMDDEDGEEGGGYGGGTGDAPMGALKLDNWTFDKVVGIPDVTKLVKFDASSPYGDKEDEFKTLCTLAYPVANFLVGEVQVSDYGDMDNDDLRLRFGLKKDDFPAYMYFKDPSSSVRYTGAVTAADLASWLRRQGLKIASVGTIADFDEIATKFAAGTYTNADVQQAERLADGDYKEDRKAAVYVKIMKSFQKKGGGYAKTETARLEKVMAGQLSEEKRNELTEKLRILGMFLAKDSKDEL